ncbi:YkvA family protein [Lysobacter cavernae]|uniref:YkvA family protein n=1 Tax=Lysobacter cavernae TaxID=1685901 RepID=A0ABV7RKA2_9GAMM
MSLTLNIELSDRDLQHFTGMIETARKAAGNKSTDEIVQAATQLLDKAQHNHSPEFVKDRLQLLDTLIAMIRDEGWALAEEDATHVRSALVYFATPSDAIPDSVPVLGFLDDAIMIELCARELHHEIEAYEDFCDFRQRESERRGLKPETVGRADWLGSRREELQERMHLRRSRDFDAGQGFGSGYGGSSSYGPIRRYSDGGWRPGLFKFR